MTSHDDCDSIYSNPAAGELLTLSAVTGRRESGEPGSMTTWSTHSVPMPIALYLRLSKYGTTSRPVTPHHTMPYHTGHTMSHHFIPHHTIPVTPCHTTPVIPRHTMSFSLVLGLYRWSFSRLATCNFCTIRCTASPML